MKATIQLILPLFHEVAGRDNEAAVQIPANHQFLNEQARHNRLASTGIVGQQVAQGLFAKHRIIDGGNLVRQRLNQRGMHGNQGVKQVGQADTIRLRGQAKEGTISIKTPRQTSGDDLQVLHSITIQQFVTQVAVDIFINELNTRRTMPFDTDHRDITARKETLNQYPRREIFQESHPQPTSFLYQPTIECIVQQMHGIKLFSICQAYVGVMITICPSDTPHSAPAQAATPGRQPSRHTRPPPQG